MRKRILGNGLEVSAVGLGCMGLSHANGAPTPKEDAIALIRKAVELGYTFFDTAETYGFEADPHHNEKIVGEALHDIRSQVVIATKFGVKFDYSKNPDHPELICDSRPETIRKSLEGSLERLQTSYVDLYYQHRIDPNVEPEVVAGVMKELIEEGKIRYWGVSFAPMDYIRRASKICPITVVENVYNIITTGDENTYFPLCEELNMGYASACPMAKGFLSAKYTKNQQFEKGDYRGDVRWFKDESFDQNAHILEVLTDIANELDATVAQVSLAWMINKKDYVIPIPGTRKLNRLAENAKAGDLILSDEQMARIEEAIKAAN